VLVVMEELAHEGATMIVVTHEMAFAREAADRVYFIDEGRFVEVGPPEQVIDAPQDPRTREFLARTHGTGAHVHGGATIDATSEAGMSTADEGATGPTGPIAEPLPGVVPQNPYLQHEAAGAALVDVDPPAREVDH
jgi:ABC-type glutathione transport system ATPase component